MEWNSPIDKVVFKVSITMRKKFKLTDPIFLKSLYDCYFRLAIRLSFLASLFFLNSFDDSLFARVSPMINHYFLDSIILNTPITIGSRLELFVDNYLIDKLDGGAELHMHHPEPKEIVIEHDAPWEGSGSSYHSIFKDGDIYRMYYKAWQLSVAQDGALKTDHPLFTCYAESNDGIHWRKPELGLFEFQGSKANNIVIAAGKFPGINTNVEISSLTAGHPAVFKDENPKASGDARYKAFFPSFSANARGLMPFKSPDGIHWSLMSDTPVITDGGFDSQNIAFWDSIQGEYRAYWRSGNEGVRAIRTGTSKDFIHWENHADLKYEDSPPEHLYTSQVKPYYRAPHLLLGFPARYIVRGWSNSMQALPEPEHRALRSISSERHGTVVTESLFMASRDGITFKRWNEAFLRPGIERPGTWAYGNQYIGWSIVETKSAEEGAPNELSLYASESYWTGMSSVLRRYTLRLDGFVSVNAPMKGGELVTKPFIFAGSKLVLNFSTSAAGGIQVEVQDSNGKVLPGFGLEDSPIIFGDNIGRAISWKNGSDVSVLKGKPVRLRFVLKDADLFSFRFI
jgi:hypothetical protein